MIKIQGKKRKDLSIITVCVWIWVPCSGCMLKWLGHSRGRASLGCPLSTWLTDFLFKLVAWGSSPRLRSQWEVMTAVSLVTYWTENHSGLHSACSPASPRMQELPPDVNLYRGGVCHAGSSVPRLASSILYNDLLHGFKWPCLTGLRVDTALTHTESWLSA